MQINTNSLSLNAMRNLESTQGGTARTLQRLSSGLRINSARDDAAGLAISDRMTTQIRGLNQATRNAMDGISLLQTAEGALSSVTANLQRIRELAVQAANATNSLDDRRALQKEVSQLVAEIDRVGTGAEFNGLKVFATSRASVVGNTDQLAVLDGLKLGWLEQSERLITDLYGLTADGVEMQIDITSFTDGVGNTAARVSSQIPGSGNGKGINITMQIDMADFTPPNLPNGGTGPVYNDRIIAHEMVHAVMARTTNYANLSNNYAWFLEGTAEFIHGADERVQGHGGATGLGAANLVAEFNNGFSGSSADYAASYAATRFLHDRIKVAGGNGIKDIMVYLNQNESATLADAIAAASSGAYASYNAFVSDFTTNGAAFIQGFNYSNADTGAIGGLDVDGGPVKTAESVVGETGSRGTDDPLVGFSERFQSIATAASTSNQLAYQVGANLGQLITTNLGAVNAAALDIANADVVDAAQRTIGQMDRALDYLNNERARIGSQMARFETAVANLQTSVESLSASRSRLQDADYASETAALTRTTILQQAGTAILAQANAQPQVVLQLLR